MAITSTPGITTTENLVAGWLTPDEFSILEVVCETLLPSLEPPAGSSEVVAAYYRRSAHDLNIAQLVAEALSFENEQAKADFRKLLNCIVQHCGWSDASGHSPHFQSALTGETRKIFDCDGK